MKAETAIKAQNRYFKTFIIGAVTCASGLCALLLLDMYLPESTERELMSLASLVLAGLGGLVAIKGYLSLAILRFRYFINSK